MEVYSVIAVGRELIFTSPLDSLLWCYGIGEPRCFCLNLYPSFILIDWCWTTISTCLIRVSQIRQRCVELSSQGWLRCDDLDRCSLFLEGFSVEDRVIDCNALFLGSSPQDDGPSNHLHAIYLLLQYAEERCPDVCPLLLVPKSGSAVCGYCCPWPFTLLIYSYI